jgi:hypothetical protein
MTDWLKSKLELARHWTKDSSSQVRIWAQSLVENLEEEIKQWRTREEEEDLA